MNGFRLRPRGSEGQSLVEFALVLPIIVLLVVGVFDVGVAVYRYNTVSESARQANRMAIVNQTVPDVQAVGVAYAPALGLAPGDIEVCFHTSDALTSDCTGGSSCDPPAMGCLAYVTVTTTYNPFTPVIGNIIGPIDLSATSVGPIEYACPNTANPTCQ
ncbi:MAG TPA: TadE/TadG family type IV pilus assembly protein [Candidatus Limnocylindria bacterium]|nr:TadE/TadG family type IV pilus assembly protein [Candidatus Limnocylindria bacterium]